MRVVLQIGNFEPKHSTENELRIALEANGLEVRRAQEDKFGWDASLAKGCDFVVWTHSHHFTDAEIYPKIEEFQDAMRKAKRPMIGYHLDRWIGLGREAQLMYDPYFLNSLLVTADGAHEDVWEEYGVHHLYFPPAISHLEAEREVEASSHLLRQKKVGFVGSWHGYHAEWPWRYTMVLWLRRTYGSKLALYPVYGQSLRGKELSVFYKCIPVIVGDSCLAPKHDGSPMDNYISDRVPETLGRGGFLLHPHVKGVTDGTLYTDGEHLICFEPGDTQVLGSLIEEWLNRPDEREKIAQAGRQHVLAHHTYKIRMRQLLDVIRGGGADWQ